jgi:hypothetical protein
MNQMWTQTHPFRNLGDTGILIKLFSGERPERPSSAECGGRVLPVRIWTLIQKCWAEDSAVRPTIDNVLKSLKPSQPAKFLFRGRSQLWQGSSKSTNLNSGFVYAPPSTIITIGEAQIHTRRLPIAPRSTKASAPSSDESLAPSPTPSTRFTQNLPFICQSISDDLTGVPYDPEWKGKSPGYQAWSAHPRTHGFSEEIVNHLQPHIGINASDEEPRPSPQHLTSSTKASRRPSESTLTSVQHLSAIHQKSNLDALDNGDDGKRSTGSLRPNPTYPTLASLEEMFEDQNISTAVIDRLKRYDKNARRAKANSMDPRELVPTRFVFKEPSGTRNTRVAHRLARLYFDLGLLGSSDILECKISSMISERSGQVGQHLRSKFAHNHSNACFPPDT